MDLDSVADELYGLPPGEFTATRNARAKQARAEGDRELAAEIQRLSRPTASAWLVNQLVRERPEVVEPLIDLGRDLRDTTARITGDELRALTQQRHQAVHALMQQARSLGAARGQRVSEAVATEVRQTLDASLADARIADAVLAGRLSRAVEYAGFGEPAEGSWPGRTASATQPRAADNGTVAEVTDLTARRRQTAERDLAEAEDSLRIAQADRRAAKTENEQTESILQAAQREVDRMRADLDTAEQKAAAAEEGLDGARLRLGRADHAVRQAEQTREEAAFRVAELEER